LRWNPNSEPDLAGYKIYFGPASHTYTDPASPFDIGNVTDVQGAAPHYGTFYIAIKAYNTSAQESEYSNEVSVTFTQPTMPVFGSMSG
jgi:hypothetical protein